MHRLVLAAALAAALAAPAAAAPTRSSPLAVASDGTVFVVNPDSNSVSRLVFGATRSVTEQPVGRYPRTLALAGGFVFTADQKSDTVSRLADADLSGHTSVDLGHGCDPYGVAATPDGSTLVVTCQGTSEVVVLTPALTVSGRVKLDWPNARAIAITADGATAYVTHYLTEEPGTDAHVSVVTVAGPTVAKVFTIPADTTTCETQNSGHGPLNLLSAIAIVPAGPLAGQVWVGGTQENNMRKGLFERFPSFQNAHGTALFPTLDFTPFPVPDIKTKKKKKRLSLMLADAAVSRDKYKPSFHDITRFGIYKLDGATGTVVGKLDIDEANNASDIEFAPDGTVAYVVDQMFNSYHIFNTRKGQDGDVTTLFAPPSSFGPGGGQPDEKCIADALNSVTLENPFRMAPQAQITPIDGYEPFDAGFTPVDTGVDFDTATYMSTDPPQSHMRAVPDAIGTAPIGVRLSPDGLTAYVANYLSRNVVPAATALPLDGTGKPANLRCAAQPTQTCATNNDCPPGQGFCNHPGGAVCAKNADCGANGPCIRSSECVPIVVDQPQSSLAGGIASDPLPPALLDGKILFNTAARDSSVPNRIGLGSPAPPFNNPTGALVPGSVVSTSHDASYVTCSACHADYGGQDGRTWDFSQFGASLRNTMDLRGRPGFAPGHCSNAPATECFFDAACEPGGYCQANPDMIPPNIPQADRSRYFNPMVTVHWNGDRDEVEDFEHTYRQLMGAGDCDGQEDINIATPGAGGGCMGALIQRNALTSSDPVDVNKDLGAPNRNIRGKVDPSKIVGIRLTHMADFVYSLTDFVTNPNPPDAAAERGRKLFNDPQVGCTECHNGGPGTGKQFFTDKRPIRAEDFDPSTPPGPDKNNPFLRHDVNTANMFDQTDPADIATKSQSFQNARAGIPGSRGTLGEYVTPVLNDVWNTAPYLHDGTAATLLDVVRPCDGTLDDCAVAGRGRNVDDKHGKTSFLTPQQLNDLAAFQDTLTLATVVGTGDRVVSAGVMMLSRATVSFGTGGKFGVTGVLSGAQRQVDPAAGVVLTLAVPSGKRMVMRSWTVPMNAGGGGFQGKLTDGDGNLVVRVKDMGHGKLRFSASGKKIDLSSIDVPDRELTVSLEISGTAFVKNRALRGTRHAFRLARKGKLT